MKRIIPIAIGIAIVGISCIIAAYYCHFYYTLHKSEVTDLERRINSFDQRLGRLEAHKARNLKAYKFWGEISTTDQPRDSWRSSMTWTNGDKFFETAFGKGDSIYPAIRLSASSTNEQEFDIHITDQAGRVVDAWFSHAEPFQDLAQFEHFHVYRSDGTNMLKLIAQVRTNSSLKMRFQIVVLSLSPSDYPLP